MAAKHDGAEPLVWPGPAHPARAPVPDRHTFLGIGAVIVALLVAQFLFLRLKTKSFTIPSFANSPTITRGDHVLMIKNSSVSRGELVVFRHTFEFGTVLVIMRVVAVGGDTVSQRGSSLYVDGSPARRPLLSGPDQVPTMLIPKGMFYALGDNRGDAADSRAYGPVPKSAVVGHLVMRFWPPGRIGSL